MKYREFSPDALLQPYIECYWIAEGDGEGLTQKIVPDGFTELIFHYGDLYRFRNFKGEEKIQSRIILAGQITQPVYLTPLGQSGVVGIKFKPTGIWKLVGWNMYAFTNDAADLAELPHIDSKALIEQLTSSASAEARIQLLEHWLLDQLPSARATVADDLVHEINVLQGTVSMAELNKAFSIPVRKMERLFNEQVGISAKRYARIVRFRHVFQLLQKERWSKAEATYLAGYFDQAHFNKEFRTFSGEDPGTYFAQHHEFANFFLNRPVVFLQDPAKDSDHL